MAASKRTWNCSFTNPHLSHHANEKKSKKSLKKPTPFFEELHYEKRTSLEDGLFDSLEDARTNIFEYIGMYYNTGRKHSALNYQSPTQYENHYFYSLTRHVNCP